MVTWRSCTHLRCVVIFAIVVLSFMSLLKPILCKLPCEWYSMQMGVSQADGCPRHFSNGCIDESAY